MILNVSAGEQTGSIKRLFVRWAKRAKQAGKSSLRPGSEYSKFQLGKTSELRGWKMWEFGVRIRVRLL